MKTRITAVGAAAAAVLAVTLVPHPNATASAHPAVRWSATWAPAMQPPVPRNDTTGPEGPNWSGGFSDQTVRQVIRVSRGGGQVRVRLSNLYGTKPATIVPFQAPYMSPAGFLRAEAIRDQVNHWIRTSGEFDAVADFATAVADPADPEELNPACNSGDFLHPDDAGYRAIAATINPNEL